MKTLIFLIFLPFTAQASELKLDGKVIHPGCVYELVTRANGDNIVSAVHLGRTRLRGCQSSNKYFQPVKKDGKGFYFLDRKLFGKGSFYYEVFAQHGNLYALRTVEHGDGTYVQRDIILTKLESSKLSYFEKSGERKIKEVQVLKLMGEVPTVSTPPQALKALKKL